MTIDLINQTFGRLTVRRMHPDRTPARKVQWVCKCQCGTLVVAVTGNLRSGNTQSCGCLQKELASEANITHGHTANGNSPEYDSYRGMLDRCRNTDNPDYGGRGITVCRRWQGPHGFEHFLTDMGARPSRRHSIERINNNRGYTPTNCRWATRADQNTNKRSSVLITYKGKTQTLSQWATERGIAYHTLYTRYTAGDRGARLFRATSRS